MNWARGATNAPAVTTRYLALYNGNPTDTGSSGTEVTTLIRTSGRLAVTFGAPSAGQMLNDILLDFGNAVNAANITHVAVFDAASSGNMLFYAPLQSAQSIDIGTKVEFLVNDLTFSIT
jgi:hypothetical protein